MSVAQTKSFRAGDPGFSRRLWQRVLILALVWAIAPPLSLVTHGDDAGLGGLVDALRADDEDVRRGAVARFEQMLNDGGAIYRGQIYDDAKVAAIVGRFGKDPAVVAAAIAGCLKSGEPETRRWASKLLHVRPLAVMAVTALRSALDDPDPEVRGNAIEALGQSDLPIPEKARLIVRMLGEDPTRVQSCTDRCIREVFPVDTPTLDRAWKRAQTPSQPVSNETLRIFRDGLRHSTPSVRRGSALALLRLGRSAAPARSDFLAALDDVDDSVAFCAAKAVILLSRDMNGRSQYSKIMVGI